MTLTPKQQKAFELGVAQKHLDKHNLLDKAFKAKLLEAKNK